MSQTGLFTARDKLDHPWWGNMCPACKAPPGEPCRGKKEPAFTTIHGQRARFSRPGAYMSEADDEWGRNEADSPGLSQP